MKVPLRQRGGALRLLGIGGAVLGLFALLALVGWQLGVLGGGSGARGAAKAGAALGSETVLGPSSWSWRAEIRQTRTQAVVPGAPPTASTVKATLVLDVEREGERKWGARVRGLEGFEARVGEESLPVPVFEGASAQVELGERGQVLGLSTPPGTPETLVGLLRLLLSEAQHTEGSPASAAWDSDEDTEVGKLHAVYSEAVASPDGRRHLDKVWAGPAPGGTPFTRVAGSARYTLGRDGGLEELEADRTVVLEGAAKRLLLEARVQVSLRRLDSAPSAPPRSSRPQAPPGPLRALSAAPSPSPDARQRALAERVGGLGLEEVKATLARESTLSGQARSDFLWRASGRLLLHPEESEALGASLDDAEASGLGDGGRLLGFELLASAGTPEAQRAMVRSLEALEAARSPKELAFLERTIALSHPEEVLVDHLRQRMDGLRGMGRAAVALVLGALGSHLDARQQADLARAFLASLASTLAATHQEDLSMSAAYVRALGNLGAPEGRDAILEQTRSTSALVRSAAAVALRRYPGPEVDEALWALSVDADPAVQRASLGVLGERPVMHAALRRWSGALRAKELGEPALGALLNVVSRWMRDDPASATELLQQIFRMRSLPPKLRARALELERQLRGAAPSTGP